MAVLLQLFGPMILLVASLAVFFEVHAGLPQANIMVLLIIRMNVFPEKRVELLQTLVSLSTFTSTENGCQRCDLCQSIEDENQLFLLEEWDTRKHLSDHLKSEHFKVLQGAMNLLKEPREIMIHTFINHPVELQNI